MKRGFIYARVATTKQAHKGKLQEQVTIMQDMAEELAIEVVDVITEIGSASSNERKGFDELLERVSEENADTILCVSIDRLCRDFSTFATIEHMMEVHDKTIITPAMTYTRAPEKMFQLTTQIALSKYEFELFNKGLRKSKQQVVW